MGLDAAQIGWRWTHAQAKSCFPASWANRNHHLAGRHAVGISASTNLFSSSQAFQAGRVCKESCPNREYCQPCIDCAWTRTPHTPHCWWMGLDSKVLTHHFHFPKLPAALQNCCFCLFFGLSRCSQSLLCIHTTILILSGSYKGTQEGEKGMHHRVCGCPSVAEGENSRW